jgi:CRP/FNR family cyclic AMP-dependent transcriptional regulator
MAIAQRNTMSVIAPQQTGIPSLDQFLEHCHRRHYPAKSVIIYAGD